MNMERDVKPHLIVKCACGKAMAFNLAYGKRVAYLGLESAKRLANIFRKCPNGKRCKVEETIVDPNKDEGGAR